MKVLFLTSYPAFYTLNFLNEFNKLVDLDVVFESYPNDSKSTENFKKSIKVINTIKIFGIKLLGNNKFPFNLRSIFTKDYDFIIIANPLHILGILSVIYLKKTKKKFAIMSEGGFHKSGKGIIEKFKKFIFSSPNFYLSGTPSQNEYFSFYGSKNKKIYRYPFASMYKDEIISNIPTNENKLKLRRKLNLSEEKIIVSVGRLVFLKGFDFLIDVAKRLTNYNFYIIGEGEYREKLVQKIHEYNIKNVTLIGYIDHENLSEYLLASDLFVHPTRKDTYGLVINEAMAHGLPVITTERCVAGTDLIKQKENGYVLKFGDTLEFIQAINNIMRNKAFRLIIAKNNLKKIKNNNYEIMAKTIVNALKTEI